MAKLSDATPLIAVDAIGFDSETTGLDTRTARIVQLGAVGLRKGALDEADAFKALVNPGVAIPPEATAIHALDDAAVKDAQPFIEGWNSFENYRRNRLVVGYSLGFDFAILEREAERNGLVWRQPRSLCVRLLTVLANPRLPNYSLDAIADWLNVPVVARHDALGDARIASEIFIVLAARLAARGVRTLAEAETACAKLDHVLQEHARSGWSEPFERPPSNGRYSSLRIGDPFAFRHRVRDAMASPPVVARSDLPLSEAIEEMAVRQISSLFLHDRGEGASHVGEYGIITERDVLRALHRQGAPVLTKPASELANRPLMSVLEEDFVFRAISAMRRNRIRHLAVTDAAGALTGVVSARDFLKLRTSAAADMHFLIETAETPATLAEAWSKLAGVASSLLQQGLEARHISEIVSGELCAITARAAELAAEVMREEGEGEAPCAYSVLVLGSAGRGESLLAADQDNAIVFENGEPDGDADRWFAIFAGHMSDNLHLAGVPLCQGGVMARNKLWRGSLETWKGRVNEWVERSRPEDMLNIDIFFDMRHAHGAAEPAAVLREYAYDRGAASPTFAKLLGEGARAVPAATGMLGGFKTDNGRIDLKKYGLFPIVSAARAMAIRYGIPVRSTAERLDELCKLDRMPVSDLKAVAQAHGLLMTMMLEQQTHDISTRIPVSNSHHTSRLDRRAQLRLKRALAAVQRIPDFIRDALFH